MQQTRIIADLLRVWSLTRPAEVPCCLAGKLLEEAMVALGFLGGSTPPRLLCDHWQTSVKFTPISMHTDLPRGQLREATSGDDGAISPSNSFQDGDHRVSPPGRGMSALDHVPCVESELLNPSAVHGRGSLELSGQSRRLSIVQA